MYLNFGINKQGEWQHISTVNSGQTELACPYCNGPLLARKGQVNSHHFAHQFDTCRESVEAGKAAALPTIDKFEMLSAKEQKYMDRREKYSSSRIYSFKGMHQAIVNLEAMGLLKVEKSLSRKLLDCQNKIESLDPTLLNDEYYPTSNFIALGEALSELIDIDVKDIWQQQTTITTSINDCYEENRLKDKHSIFELLEAQKFWLQAHYDKQCALNPDYTTLIAKKVEALSVQHLYLFKFYTIIGGEERTFIKIGMTTRTAEERLGEVINDLNKHIAVVDAEILSFVKYAGRIEPLLHHYYQKDRFHLANFKELFCDSIADNLVEQIEELKQLPPLKPFNLKRQFKVRIPNSKTNSGRRPKTKKELIEEYPDVVSLLKSNVSIREVARQTGRAKNTVQRVRSALLH